MTNNCVYCRIYKESNDKEVFISKKNHFIAIFEPYPVSPKHATTFSTRHVNSILQLNKEEWNELKTTLNEVVHKIEKTNFYKLYEKFLDNPLNDKTRWYSQQMLNHFAINKKPEGYNFGINQGNAAGQTIFHLHIHIIPRYKGDAVDPTGGVRNGISQLGNYKK